jgi:hypothetical protein
MFTFSYKMLMDTYPREYNKFEVWVVVHNVCDLIYANEKMDFDCFSIDFIMFYNKFCLWLLHSSMIQGKGNLQ